MTSHLRLQFRSHRTISIPDANRSFFTATTYKEFAPVVCHTCCSIQSESTAWLHSTFHRAVTGREASVTMYSAPPPVPLALLLVFRAATCVSKCQYLPHRRQYWPHRAAVRQQSPLNSSSSGGGGGGGLPAHRPCGPAFSLSSPAAAAGSTIATISEFDYWPLNDYTGGLYL